MGRSEMVVLSYFQLLDDINVQDQALLLSCQLLNLFTLLDVDFMSFQVHLTILGEKKNSIPSPSRVYLLLHCPPNTYILHPVV